MQENKDRTDNHSFKVVIEKILKGIPDLFFSWGPGGSFRPTLLTFLIIIVPMFLFKDKIVSGVSYLMNLIGR